MQRSITAAAGAALAALLVSSCATGEGGSEAAAPSSTATSGAASSPGAGTGDSTSTPSSEIAEDGPEWEEAQKLCDDWSPETVPADTYQALIDMGYPPNNQGALKLPGPVDRVPAPNGETWDVDMFYDVATLIETSETGGPSTDPASFDCSEQWDSVDYLLLRGGSEDSNLYGSAATAGPTCFETPGGALGYPGIREAHYVCQTAGTTARALVSYVDEGPVVWTPENTTRYSRQCIGFDAEVTVHEVEVTSGASDGSDGEGDGQSSNPAPDDSDVDYTFDHVADGRHGLEVSVSFDVEGSAEDNEANVLRGLALAVDRYPEYDLIIVRGYGSAAAAGGPTQVLDAWYTPEDIANIDLENPAQESAYEHCYSCSANGQHRG